MAFNSIIEVIKPQRIKANNKKNIISYNKRDENAVKMENARGHIRLWGIHMFDNTPKIFVLPIWWSKVSQPVK